MPALGFIETKGLLAAVESADVMLKSANVQLVDRSFVGGGLVAITIKGDVSAVKASVDAAVSALYKFGDVLVSQHVIARPHEELDRVVVAPSTPEEERPSVVKEATVPLEAIVAKVIVAPEVTDATTLDRGTVEAIVAEQGFDKALPWIEQFKVVKLRALARTYPELGMNNKEISNARKDQLLEKLKKHYQL